MGALIAGALAATLVALGNTPAAAQGAVRSVHGDWRIRCDTRPARKASDAPDPERGGEDRSNAGLTVIVLKTADQRAG